MATIYETVVSSAEDFLRQTDSTGPEKSKSNQQILAGIRKQAEDGFIQLVTTDGTIKSYLSYAASDPDNFIVSGGPKAGYWLNKRAVVALEAEAVSKKGDAVGPVQERDLYPLIEAWLGTKGYKSKDASTLKSGGKWGNPDIVGVNLTQAFGATEIETASCEVKLSIDGWEQYIFEAISHKRFCTRSWYCFRVDNPNLPLPKGMQDYAERYRVGIVQISLSDTDLKKIKNSPDNAAEFITSVNEKIPALYDHVALADKVRLLQRANIEVSLGFSG